MKNAFGINMVKDVTDRKEGDVIAVYHCNSNGGDQVFGYTAMVTRKNNVLGICNSGTGLIFLSLNELSNKANNIYGIE